MSDDDLGARMYANATQPDRGSRVTGTAQTTPAEPVLKPVLQPADDAPGTTSTPPPVAVADPGRSAAENATPAAGPTKPHTPTQEAPATGDVPLDTFTPAEDEFLDREQSLGERMVEQAAMRPDDPSGYSAALGAGFDALEAEARETHNEVDIEALAEGRRVAAELMHALAVPTQQAKEVVGAMSAWHSRELTDEQVEDLGDRAEAELRAEWGKDYPAKLALAKRAAAEATAKAPWLRDLWATGCGNDPAVIRQFAAIGARAARRARRAKK